MVKTHTVTHIKSSVQVQYMPTGIIFKQKKTLQLQKALKHIGLLEWEFMMNSKQQ